MAEKYEVSVFRMKVIRRFSAWNAKFTYKELVFTVPKREVDAFKSGLNALEEIRTRLLMGPKLLGRAAYLTDKSDLQTMINALNHLGLDIRNKGGGNVEYRNTDATK